MSRWLVFLPSFLPQFFFFLSLKALLTPSFLSPTFFLISYNYFSPHLFQLIIIFFYFPSFLSLPRFFSSLPIIFFLIYSNFVSSSPHNFKILNDLPILSYFLSLLTHISSYISLLLNVLINSIIFSLSFMPPHKFIPYFFLSLFDSSSPHQFNPISCLLLFLLTLSLPALPLPSHIATVFSPLYSLTIYLHLIEFCVYIYIWQSNSCCLPTSIKVAK